MKPSASDQRRVLQCPCGAAIPWRGEEGAVAAGWGRARSPEGEVLAEAWRCPDCRPRGEARCRTPRLPDVLRAMIADGDRHAAIAQLEGMRSADPSVFAASLETIRTEAAAYAVLTGGRGVRQKNKVGAHWITLAQLYGVSSSG